MTTDEYVWLYTEDANWWTGENIPEDFAEAMRRARQKVKKIEPLGYSVEKMLEQARERAEQQGK